MQRSFADCLRWYSLLEHPWDVTQYWNASLRPYLLGATRADVVNYTVSLRASQVSCDHSVLGLTIESAPRGRLLAYRPDSETWDQLASSESHGFLDGCSCPPWSVWIGWIDKRYFGVSEEFLVAWVPADFVEAVSRSVSCATTDQVVWLSDASQSIEREIVMR